MPVQLDRPPRRAVSPPLTPYSSAPRLALVVALAATSLYAIAATAQVLPAPSGSVASPPASAESQVGADGSRAEPGASTSVWIETALIAVAVATAAAMIAWIVERSRRRSLTGADRGVSARPSQRKKSLRRRR
jgi:hypothetical protein